MNWKKFFVFSTKQWIFIVLMMTTTICFQFCYDIPASFQTTLMSDYKISASQFSLLYSLYSLPCIVTTIIGGYLIDGILGPKKSSILFSSISLTGQVLFAIGGYSHIYWLMVVGRFVFGSGQEAAFSVCTNYYKFLWFKEDFVNLIFSISDNFSYLGSTAVYQTSNRLYEYLQHSAGLTSGQAVKGVLVIDSCVMLLSFVCNVGIPFIKYKKNDEADNEPEATEIKPEPNKNDSNSQLVEVQNQQEIDNESNPVKFFDFVKFPASYWLLCIVYASISNAVYTFEQFSQQTFTQGFSLSIDDANNVISVMNFSKIACSIPFSLIVDSMGRNTIFLSLSVVSAIAAHICLLFHVSPYISMALLGAGYSLTASTIWPMFLYPLNKMHYGLGYGMVTSITNLTSFIFPLIAGKIIDEFGLDWLQVFYLGVLLFGFLSLIIVWYVDNRSIGILNMKAKQRKIYLQNPSDT